MDCFRRRDFTLLLKPDKNSVFAEGAQFHSSSGPLDYKAQVYTGKLEGRYRTILTGVTSTS